MLLGQQGVGLRLDAGQRRLQFVRHHRDEVGAHLVDLLEPLHPFFLQRLPAARFIQLTGALDGGAQRSIEPPPHVADQQAGNERDEDEQKDATDDEPRRRRDPGESSRAADHHVQR